MFGDIPWEYFGLSMNFLADPHINRYGPMLVMVLDCDLGSKTTTCICS